MGEGVFSPLRAVMFWPENDPNPEEYPLVRLGMLEYIYNPLGTHFPTNTDDSDAAEMYKRNAHLVYDYVTFGKPLTSPQLITILEGGKMEETPTKPPSTHQWRIASNYHSIVIDSIASRKSQMACAHVSAAERFQDIVPNPVIPIDDLKYSEETLRFLHRIGHSRFFSNPMSLFRDLIGYMDMAQKNPTTAGGSNLYICTFIYSLVKACRRSLSTTLLLAKYIITEGVCFGSKNQHIKRVMDQYTVKVCPWCYKPVNLVVKKKSAPGGSHKSQVFSDDYTCEPLYCTEKNTRGVLSFPLISVDKTGTVYSNAFEWQVNSGFTRVFLIEQSKHHARLNIYNKTSGALLFTPIETKPTCKPDDLYKCLLCSKKR